MFAVATCVQRRNLLVVYCFSFSYSIKTFSLLGTYTDESGDAKLYSSVAGIVEKINKLVCVRALKTRYNGEVGDIIVGRVKEVQQKRWKVYFKFVVFNLFDAINSFENLADAVDTTSQ